MRGRALVSSAGVQHLPLNLLILSGRAVNSTDGSEFVPPHLATRDRCYAAAAARRGFAEPMDWGLRTPQNIDEGIAFFSDGWKIFLWDVRRNRLLSNGDTIAAYAWFSLLAVSPSRSRR